MSGLGRSGSARLAFGVRLTIEAVGGKCSDWASGRIVCSCVGVWLFCVVDPLTRGMGLIEGL